MGIPAENPPASTKSAADLPPEALDLAAKLFDFAREGQTAELQTYLDGGIPPNLTNAKGDTLLMLAAYHGHPATVQMLLAKGADPNALNDRGQSPLAGAVFKSWDEVVKALHESGADIRAGHPNAVDSAKMFKKEAYLKLFGVES
jgi:uncharacterized protein